jgi:AAA family ATP:ADP antiporter
MIDYFKGMMDIRRDEWRFALSMFLYFFLVITTFWILKPIKKTLFVVFYDQTGFAGRTAAQAEQYAKIGNLIIAFLAVIVFTWLARRFRRQQLTYVLSAFFAVGYLVYLPLISQPTDLTVWSFYWFGDLYSTFMVVAFFAFLNDSMTPEAAKRLYGIVGLGGVVGGVVGATFVGVWIDRVSTPGWLLICLVLSAGIVAVAAVAGREVQRHPPPTPEPQAKEEKTKEGNPALEGAKLVFRSRYLLAIVAIVGLYELVSALADYVFTETASHYLVGDQIGRYFSRVFAVTNWASMAVQLFFTSLVMTRLGVGVALVVLPLSMVAATTTYGAFPLLWAGGLLKIADGSFAYSINQSAKEAMYVPTTPDEKYKAKAFIDMFVQRLGKVVAIVLVLGITTVFTDFSVLRWIALITAVLGAVWMWFAWYGGREFKLRASK